MVRRRNEARIVLKKKRREIYICPHDIAAIELVSHSAILYHSLAQPEPLPYTATRKKGLVSHNTWLVQYQKIGNCMNIVNFIAALLAAPFKAASFRKADSLSEAISFTTDIRKCHQM